MKKLFNTLRVFYAFETRHKLAFAGLMFFTFANAITNASLPFFFKYFFESISNFDSSVVIRIILIYVAIRFANLIFHTLAFFIGDFTLHYTAIDVRKETFKHVQDLDFSFHASKSSGSLISIFKRGDSAIYSLHHVLNYQFINIFVGFVVMAYIFSSLNPVIGLATLFSFAISIAVTLLVVSYNVKTRQKINEEDDKVSSIIVDNMINFETVKLFAKEKYEENRLNNAFADWWKAAWGYANSFRVIDISIGGLVNLSILVTLLISVELLTKKQLGLGDFVLVLAFVNSFFPRLWDLVYSFREVAKNYTDIQKYLGLFDYQIEVKDPNNPVRLDKVKGEIVFDNVSFTYAEAKRNAVRDFNLSVSPGESIALVGRSGSGKTTLMKLLMRFYDVNEGKISIDGIGIKDLTKSDLRNLMGVVPQEPILFNNTIGYNIGYGKENASMEEIKTAAKMANLNEFIESLPQKFETHVGERGIKLSGGQKQRLAIARMILSSPDIIIFDEATSQLDSENERLIQDAFWKVAKGKTTFIIAHRLSTAKRANRIVVMQKGKIKEIDTHKGLLHKKDSLYKYFWNLQTK